MPLIVVRQKIIECAEKQIDNRDSLSDRQRMRQTDPQREGQVMAPGGRQGLCTEALALTSGLSSSLYVLLANTADLTTHSGHLARLRAQ